MIFYSVTSTVSLLSLELEHVKIYSDKQSFPVQPDFGTRESWKKINFSIN